MEFATHLSCLEMCVKFEKIYKLDIFFAYMKITLFTNYVNHHQIPFADELYRILGDDFRFVATNDTRELIQAMSGYSEIERPYIVRTYTGKAEKQTAFDLAIYSDVVIYGSVNTLPFVKARHKAGINKLTFEAGERWFKRGLIHLLSPNLWRNKWIYHLKSPKDYSFRLCSGAYAARDERLLLSYKHKCFKWGYFAEVQDIDIEETVCSMQETSTLKILWVARFLRLKHPEMMLQLASVLRNNDIDFSIAMIGEGPLLASIKEQIIKQNLQSNVHLLGVMPNSEVIQKMREYDVFCLTSDRCEGWGAVINEAMAAGCCPVACKSIGSVPFLINNGVNGFLFNENDFTDFADKIIWLSNHRQECKRMGLQAYFTMKDDWNPTVAASRLTQFCESFLRGEQCSFETGPMSDAPAIRR